MAGHIQSAGDVNWLTPDWINEKNRLVFGGPPSLDPCSNPDSKVGALTSYMLPETDGLKASWDHPTIFVNPPYGRTHMHKVTRTILSAKVYKDLSKAEKAEYTSSTIYDWVDLCVQAQKRFGSQVIALIPAAIETQHWHDLIFPTARAICFPRGRVKFDQPAGTPPEALKNQPPMGAALVYWGSCVYTFQQAYIDRGVVLLDWQTKDKP